MLSDPENVRWQLIRPVCLLLRIRPVILREARCCSGGHPFHGFMIKKVPKDRKVETKRERPSGDEDGVSGSKDLAKRSHRSKSLRDIEWCVVQFFNK